MDIGGSKLKAQQVEVSKIVSEKSLGVTLREKLSKTKTAVSDRNLNTCTFKGFTAAKY